MGEPFAAIKTPRHSPQEAPAPAMEFVEL
jgi:hypothetical protein